MKKIIITAILILFPFSSFALNFNQNITKYMVNNTGATSDIYIFNRCSGVAGYLYSMLNREPGKENTANIYLRVSTLMTDRAAMLYSKHSKVNYNKSIDENMKRAAKMTRLYAEDAKEMFYKNGSYISGIVKDDLNFCIGFEKELRKK